MAQEINIFKKMDSLDEIQILNPEMRNKLAYEIEIYNKKTNKKEIRYELSYAGIKQLILEMSQKGQSMEVLREKVFRDKIDNEPLHDVWYAEVVIKNKQSGHESWGVSEAPAYVTIQKHKLDDKGTWIKGTDGKYVYETVTEYDPFGRTKSVSKAIRNAERQQLPEMLIAQFVENTKQIVDKVQKIVEAPDETITESNFCQCPEDIKNNLPPDPNNKCRNCNKKRSI